MSRLDDRIKAAIKADPRAQEERQIIYWTGEAMFAEGKTEEQIEICIRHQTEAEVRLRLIEADIEIKMRAADKVKRRNRFEFGVASLVGILLVGFVFRVDLASLVTEWSPQAAFTAALIFIGFGVFVGFWLREAYKLALPTLCSWFNPEPPAPFIIEDEFGNEAVFTPNGRGDGKVTLLD